MVLNNIMLRNLIDFHQSMKSNIWMESTSNFLAKQNRSMKYLESFHEINKTRNRSSSNYKLMNTFHLNSFSILLFLNEIDYDQIVL